MSIFGQVSKLKKKKSDEESEKRRREESVEAGWEEVAEAGERRAAREEAEEYARKRVAEEETYGRAIEAQAARLKELEEYEREAPRKPTMGGGVPKQPSLKKEREFRIKLKAKTRWKEMTIACAVGIIVYIVFNQWILFLGALLFAFYIALPSESDIISESRDAVSKGMEKKQITKEKAFREEKLKGEAERAYLRRKGEIRAEREYGG